MGTLTITGNDTLTLNGHVFNDLSTGDTCMIDLPNELINSTTGKNGNAFFAQNFKGYNSSMSLKLSRGSTDDQFLAGILAAIPADFPSMQLLSGTFVKRLGDGHSNVVSDIYTLAGGTISKIPGAKENVDGDTTQAEVMYALKFVNTKRVIG